VCKIKEIKLTKKFISPLFVLKEKYKIFNSENKIPSENIKKYK